MPFGAVAANRLALALPRTQPLDHRRPDEEGDGERRDHRAAAAKGEVAEQVEQRDAVGERDEQVVEHAARVPTVRSLLWRWAGRAPAAPRPPPPYGCPESPSPAGCRPAARPCRRGRPAPWSRRRGRRGALGIGRKSTRLNSSH